MSEVVLLENVILSGEKPDSSGAPNTQAPLTLEASVPQELRDEKKAPSQEANIGQDISPRGEPMEETKVIPRPVTVEEVHEHEPEPMFKDQVTNESAKATQATESVALGDTHLSPKPSALTTSASPATADANDLLPPLPDTPTHEVEPDLTAFPVADVPKSPKDDENRDIQRPVARAIPRVVPKPAATALSFLDADSPPVTKEAIRQSTLNATRRGHPGVFTASTSAYSHSSMGSVAHSSDVPSGAHHGVESNATWSPTDRYSLKAEGPPPPSQHHSPDFRRSWTSTEARMPPPPMSQVGQSPTHPRFPQPSPFPFNDHIPPSGYQLVATKLAGDLGGMHVKPIYRRFEALNHRILLSLQDEIQHLEEQLYGVDSTDTQNRTYPGGIYPASLRQEASSGGELYWRKTEILTQIGYRLQQYNKLLISFRDITDLPAPTVNDIQDYRSFLNHGNFITSDELRFLAATNDLITLDEALLRGTDEYSEDLLTPMPRSATEPEFPIQLTSAVKEIEKVKTPIRSIGPVDMPKPDLPASAISHLALAIFVAVLVPIFTFAVIPDFVARITVVLLVASSVASTLFQSGLVGLLVDDCGVLAMLLCVVTYGCVMTLAAATFS